ncbi:MAG: DUF6160 family protein [Desulfatibacillaceae bacterium]
MKKGILAVAIAALMMLPLAAMAGMLTGKAPLSDSELAGITGQTGVTIDMSLEVTDGYVAYGDDDGTTDYTDEGFFTLSGMAIDDGAGGPTQITGLTIDVGTNTDGDSALIIGLPSISGRIGFSALKLGTTADGGSSLGSLTIGDLTTSASTIIISPHD